MLEATSDPDNPGEVCDVIMRNISEDGIAFWSRRRFPIRTPVYVREYATERSTVWFAAHVTHCTIGIRGYLIGARFAVSPRATPGGIPTQTKRGLTTEARKLY
jgi:hypothetical protein